MNCARSGSPAIDGGRGLKQTRDMMRGGDNAELIAELRELRARLDKIERNTAVLPQTHDVIDRVTAGGNAMLTEAA